MCKTFYWVELHINYNLYIIISSEIVAKMEKESKKLAAEAVGD